MSRPPIRTDPPTDRELSKEFDWVRNEGTVTAPGPPPIAVYRNNYGQVVVRQKAAHPMDYDSIIVIDHRDVWAVAAAMKGAAALAEAEEKSERDGEG